MRNPRTDVEAMSAPAFDTLQAARNLESAGVERTHAEAIASAIGNGHGSLVTNDHLDAKLSDLENRLVKWGLALAGAAVIILGFLIRWP